ncbi:MAG: FAD:protein FMN transferase [Treponema sp.]|jgi:thiamine biosynthesis lipoprotein|nr:FAD:protein FMN transferase [Treponema sp.]
MKYKTLAVLTALCFSACSRGEPSESELVLGTVCTIQLYEYGKKPIYQKIFNRFHAIEDTMSANKSGTELERINANAGIAPVTVSSDLFSLIETALFYAELSHGAFDPTVGPLVKLWNIGFDPPQIPLYERTDLPIPETSSYSRIPTQAAIDAALSLVDYRQVQLDPEQSSVFLLRAGMGLDLGAIAKGYAADEAVRILFEAAIPRAIINLGGNVFAFGIKKDRSPWRIGIQDPRFARDSGIERDIVGYVEVHNATLVTSGVYERFFEEDGVHYHHILSPKDGYPARTGLLSVTVITDSSTVADVLSTAVFVLGYDKGRALIESLDGVEALFIFEDMHIEATRGAFTQFHLTNDSFELTDSIEFLSE